jgi:hypothetical protein
MARLGRVERLQIMLSEDELVALDDWRFSSCLVPASDLMQISIS